jgi:tetratricopeptide (TPR) repeat protein
VDQRFAEAVRHHIAGDNDDAEALYLSILAVPPIQSEASYNLGLLYQTTGRLMEAVAAYQNAVRLRNDHVDAYNNLGTALQALRAWDSAVAMYRKAIVVRPEHETSYCNLGVVLKEEGHLPESVAAYRRAIDLKPSYDWAYANMAAALIELDRFEDSVDACRQALAVNPKMPMALFNLGTALKAQNRLEEAEAALRDALGLNPDFVEAHFTLGQILLHQEKYADGWREYEWRWRLPQYSWLKSLHGEFSQPRWRGEDIAGKTLLVYAEQGAGDTIQYARYIPMLAEKTGARIIFAVHRQLLRLLGQIDKAEVIALDQSPLPQFDLHSPLLSLPGLLGTDKHNIPAEVPYLKADPLVVDHWRRRIGEGGKKKIGIVWAGNPEQTGDRLRSPGLAAVMRLFENSNVTFIALQVGPGRNELSRTPLPPGVIDLGLEVADFFDTAAIMADLDLMISSCTAPLHLASALGIPTWAMIPFAAHFLWQSERSDSPWYPKLRLYRQEKPGLDWSGVISAIDADVKRL